MLGGRDKIDRRIGWHCYLLDKCPPGAPGAYWRSFSVARRFMAVAAAIQLFVVIPISVGVVLLMFLGDLDAVVDKSLSRSFALFYLLSALLCLACCLVPYIAKKRYKRHVLRNQCELCLQCGYLLSSLPPEHVCPECGTPYTIEETKQAWDAWLNRKFI